MMRCLLWNVVFESKVCLSTVNCGCSSSRNRGGLRKGSCVTSLPYFNVNSEIAMVRLDRNHSQSTKACVSARQIYKRAKKKYWRLSSSSLWPARGFWKWEAAKIDIRTKNISSGERSEDRWADSLVRAPVFPASMWTPWRILVLKQTYLLVFLFRSEENALRTKEFEICLPETTVLLTPHQAK